MDNKRKGSSPPRSPGGDEEVEWREPAPREPSPFAFSDDDDSPLPAPPEFDGRREGVPELIDGDMMDDEVATAEELETEEPELLDGSLITEVRPTHRMPPPIPAPVPTGPGKQSFVDDGEIALPPRISQAPQSFPFRQLRRDEESGVFEPPDDEPAPDSAGWRSAALRRDAAPEEEEAEEVEAEEVVEDAPDPPPPPPRAPAFAFTDDDDDDATPLVVASPRPPPAASASDSPRYRDPAHMFADESDESDETLASRRVPVDDDSGAASVLVDAPGENLATGLVRLPAGDDDDPDSEATALYATDQLPSAGTSGGWVQPRPPQPSAAIPVAALDDDDDDAAWVVPPAARPAPREADDETVATRAPALADDDTLLTAVRPPTDDDDDRDDRALPTDLSPATSASASLRSLTDDVPETHPPALSGAIMVADQGDDDDEWVPRPAAQSGPPAPAPAPARADDEEDDEWVPQTAAVGLAPAPTDLGEAFPLDLWSDPDELIGRDLGQHRLIKPLSRGMITRVYAGETLTDEQFIAVRVLAPTYSPAEPRARQFLYEAQQLARLRSDNIVAVRASGTTPDHLTYYVMELLDGETLAAVLRAEGPLPWSDVAAFAQQMCDALIVAGDAGVIHGDLTTATCMRLRPAADEPPPPEGERRRAKIKLLGVGVTPLTSTYRNPDGGLAVSQGTPPGAAEYMAPEIASGGRPDVHTQIYAIGVIMYELLTGRVPFRGDSFLAVLKKQMYDEPVAPHLVVPEQEIPEAFEQLVLKALAKAPADRFADLRALSEALQAARVRERRVNQLLSLDPTDWDEEGSRNAAASARLPSAPARAAAVVEPAPLATFAADLKEKNPELAAKVFDQPPPPKPAPPVSPLSRPPASAGPSVKLTHLAAPVTAPPPVVQPSPGQLPVIVLQRPDSGSLLNVRNVSVAIIALCFLVLFGLWMTDRGGTKGKGKEVAVDTKGKGAPAKTRKPAPKPVVDDPDIAPPVKKDVPAVVPDPPPAKQAEPPPVEPPPVEPDPPPTKQALPPPVEPDPPPTKQALPPPTKVEPPPTKVAPPPTKKPPPSPTDEFDDRPERIEPGRLTSKLRSMEARVRTACSSKSGMPNPKGLKVAIKVVVNPKGATNVTATGAWAGTPMGNCVEQFLEGMLSNFNETRSGGSVKYTIEF